LEPAFRERVDALRQRRGAESGAAETARRVVVRRVGWAAAGGVGTLLGAAALLRGLLSFTMEGKHGAAAATSLLVGAWPAALVAGLASCAAARALTSRALDVPLVLSGDPAADLARFEAADPLRRLRELAQRLEFGSVALPLAALSLVAPLSIHAVVCVLLGGGVWVPLAEEFGTWIGISALIVGHAHLVLLAMAVGWASSLRRSETSVLRAGVHRSWGRALIVTVGVSAVPGIVLVAIPPLLVLLTGLAFVPAMYLAAAKRVERERLALGVGC
jgi:hypothetical protein